MASTEPMEPVAHFTRELLGTGCMLFDLAADLAELLPADAYPGEEPGQVVLEMVIGTIATAIGDADPADLRRATELISEAAERVIEHLKLASELSRRMHVDGDGQPGRAYG